MLVFIQEWQYTHFRHLVCLWDFHWQLIDHFFNQKLGYKVGTQNWLILAILYFKHFCYFIIHWCYLPINPLFGRWQLSGDRIYPTVSYIISMSLSLEYRVDKKVCKKANIVTILSNTCLLRLKSNLNLVVTCLSIIYVNLSHNWLSQQK